MQTKTIHLEPLHFSNVLLKVINTTCYYFQTQNTDVNWKITHGKKDTASKGCSTISTPIKIKVR